MQYFGGKLPPTLHALPQQARKELAELLMADDAPDDEMVQLPPDIEASLAQVLWRIDTGAERMFSSESVISEMKTKYT